jgi:hypothetical protein
MDPVDVGEGEQLSASSLRIEGAPAIVLRMALEPITKPTLAFAENVGGFKDSETAHAVAPLDGRAFVQT